MKKFIIKHVLTILHMFLVVGIAHIGMWLVPTQTLTDAIVFVLLAYFSKSVVEGMDK